MKHRVYSHALGKAVVPTLLSDEISSVISCISVYAARGRTSKLRFEFLEGIKATGWSDETPVSTESKMTITSTKQDIGLCLQTGNMGRMYADLLKLQTMRLNNAIKAAIIVVPSQPIAKLLGENIANANRLERELIIFQSAYSVPTLVFALE